jgi:hypothetical protein
MGIRISNSSQKSFTKSGYILNSETLSSNTSDDSTVKYYFDEGVNYKNSYDGIEFKDTNGDKVKVDEASFVHYSDDSISLLKKGVIFNLDELNSEVPKYYNLFEGTVLENSNSVYYVDNLGKKLKFKRFIIRISDSKYLIVSDSIKLKIDSEKETTIKANYVELNFVEGGIIRLENQEATYQTIAKDAILDLGNDITLNLDNEYFYLEKEAKINLKSIIIDSDDNIDITPIEEDDSKESEDSEDSEDNSTGTGSYGGNGGSSEEEGDDSVSNGSVTIEEEVVENELTTPTAIIDDMTISSNKLDASIKLNDSDSLLTGTAYTTIVENSTGKTVYAYETDEGTYRIDLTVETTYNLTTRVTYKKNDIEYTMDIVSQLFTTESVGITVNKDYYSSNELAFNVKIEDYSKVKSAVATLYTSTGKTIAKYDVTSEAAKSDDGQQLIYNGLTSDTKYSLIISEILYDNYVISDDYDIEMSAKTLKTRPTVGTVGFTIDKKNGTFVLKLSNTSDPNNGIESYRYEVYINSGIDDKELVTTIDKNNSGSVDLVVDSATIYRGVSYVFRVVAEFYDNEKYIEYTTAYSDTMKMDGVEAPTLSWKADEVTFEKITGTLTINDPGNTVDAEKEMTIVYTNSIGTTLSFTTAGNTIIPFSVNNLRANETYTISVYASVNLQDGNPTVDKYHVGSAIVKTEETKAFDTSFAADSSNTSYTFYVNARLTNGQTYDNTLEANTLTGISFALYEGTNTSGTLVKLVKKADRDLREYYSDLKTSYYDSSFVLDPSFFGLKNSDLTADYYTIAILNAYDYTDFQNNIPIKNNTITVKSNGTPPDDPPVNAKYIDYEAIRNKDAGDHYDSNLDASTIVGIKIKSTYDNSKRYLKYINYHVFDAATNKELEDYAVKYEVGTDGSVDYVTFWFDYGTEYGTEDTELRRGHKYYFTYDAALDINHDGTPETRYPSNTNTILKSDTIFIVKQAPILKTYTSTSTANSITMKYVASDVDHAYINGKATAYITQDVNVTATDERSSVEFDTNTNNEYKEMTFTNLKSGYLNIRTDYCLYTNIEEFVTDDITYQYFEGEYAPSNLSFSVDAEKVNRVIISIDNYNTTSVQNTLARIAGLKLTFTCEGQTIVKDFVKLSNDTAVVDMYDLSDFLGKKVSLKVQAYYDSGLVGFDIGGEDTEKTKTYFALQSVKDVYGGGTYFTLNSLGNLVDSDEAMGSVYSRVTNSKTIKLTNKNSDRSVSFNNSPTSDGYSLNYEKILLKKLIVFDLTNSGDETFTFNQIIPGISFRDSDDVEQISPTISSVIFKADVHGFGSSSIKDDKIYVQLFTTDEDGLNLEAVGEPYEYSLDELNSNIEISGLVPKQNYALQFSAYIDDGEGGYDYKRLYDLDDNTDNKTYYFKTLSSIKISNVSAKYYASSYNNKYISISYKLDTLLGFDRIEYTMYKRVYNDAIGDFEFQKMDLEISDSVVFITNMEIHIDCNPGSVFEFGKQYRIVITPIVSVTVGEESEDVILDGPGDLTFNLTALHNPYISINSSVSSNESVTTGTALDFKVSVYDVDKVVVSGQYQIQVLDPNGKDITPSKYADTNYSISGYNRTFTIDKLTSGSTYTFIVKYQLDKNNDIESSTNAQKTYTATTLNTSGIDVGTITATANSSISKKIDLNFSNSTNLTSIDTIRYSIYNSSDGSSQDNQITFSPTQKKVNSTTSIYVQTLPESLPESSVYYIQIQFISSGSVITEKTLEYTYIAS